MEVDKKFGSIGKKFGIGIVGLGEGEGLVKGLEGHPELTTYGVCDNNEQLLTHVSYLYKVPDHYIELEKMLENNKIEIVVIYTPDQYHLEHIKMCVRSGKHVVCTKPLVTSLSEAQELMDFSKKYPNQKIMVGQSTRFFKPFAEQRKKFEEGKLGKISFLEAHYNHDMRWFYNKRFWTKDNGFDLLFACTSHPVDLVMWYMGYPSEVFAYASTTKIATDSNFVGSDVFNINFKFEDGRIARVLGLYGIEYPHQSRAWIECSLYGDKGTYIAKYPQLESISKYENCTEQVEYYFEDIFHHFQFEGIKHHAGEFLNYTEYFARSIAEGIAYSPNIVDGYKTMFVLERIRESINTGFPVKVTF